MVLALGFLLLLVALQAPLIAAVGVVTNLLATGAAFGVAKLIFQDGALQSLLGFQSQGFLDAWGPVFFFAMIFAISMDYTVFLLSSAKEHWDRSHNPREAMVGGLAHSGRVIFAAAAVMVAVFFTFALSGPLPPKEMGVILGLAVLLDALLVRLLLVPAILQLLGRRAWAGGGAANDGRPTATPGGLSLSAWRSGWRSGRSEAAARCSRSRCSYTCWVSVHQATTTSLLVVAAAALAGGVGHSQTGSICCAMLPSSGPRRSSGSQLGPPPTASSAAVCCWASSPW